MTAVINQDIVKVFISPNISNMKQTFCIKIMGKILYKNPSRGLIKFEVPSRSRNYSNLSGKSCPVKY
jgi:hypothetical protein